MIRPKRLLEVGSGYTTPFLLEALINNERVFEDGNLYENYIRDCSYDPKLVIIYDMSLGEFTDRPAIDKISESKYVEFIRGEFQGKARKLFESA